jgi:hypothetical protein
MTILLVKNAGHGETPPRPNALFKCGDVVKVRDKKALAHFPRELIIAVAVPSGFPPEYALADLVGEPRPLMISKGSRAIRYILVRENDPVPYIARERDLLPSGKPRVEIGSIRREAAA